ncbi:MAG: class I adenylate-forming enzyme family protein [Pasteurellaceae bacterium]|nr:class I adenylate-forming enzyme family protein [Pasteurellaceae bacterium]
MNNVVLTNRTLQIHQQLVQDKVQAVGLYLEDATQFACVLLACLQAGVKVLLPPNLLVENRQWLADNSALLFDEDVFAHYGIWQKVAFSPPLVTPQHDTEIWLKTSGSSGQAKIIKKTARQMWQEAEALAQALPFSLNEDIQVIGSVSVQHLYGLTFRIFLPLFMGWQLGGKQLHYPEYLLAESKHHRTLWVSSPALLSNLNLASLDDHLQIAGIISSGGSLPEATAAALRQKLPCPLVEIYGSTETGVIAHRQQAGLWQPMPNSQIGLNEQGALWVESPWIAAREQTADAVNLHPEGFELLGRIDRIVKLGDKRLSLVRLEQALLQHSAVQDCYIALHPDHPRPVAWVALTSHGVTAFQQGRKALIAELRQHLSQTQEKFALPRYWRFSLTLPRNSQSKIRRTDFEQICRHPEDEII